MKQKIIKDEKRTFRRVTKTEAVTADMAGRDVIICPCRLNPEKTWKYQVWNREWRKEFVIDEIGVRNDFLGLVDSFAYYVCGAKAGLYMSYYIEVTE